MPPIDGNRTGTAAMQQVTKDTETLPVRIIVFENKKSVKNSQLDNDIELLLSFPVIFFKMRRSTERRKSQRVDFNLKSKF